MFLVDLWTILVVGYSVWELFRVCRHVLCLGSYTRTFLLVFFFRSSGENHFLGIVFDLPGPTTGSGFGLNGDLQQTSMDPGQFPPTNWGGAPCGSWLWSCLFPRFPPLVFCLFPPVVFIQSAWIRYISANQKKTLVLWRKSKFFHSIIAFSDNRMKHSHFHTSSWFTNVLLSHETITAFNYE